MGTQGLGGFGVLDNSAMLVGGVNDSMMHQMDKQEALPMSSFPGSQSPPPNGRQRNGTQTTNPRSNDLRMRQGIKAIGGNGQISPVSGNSMANFTENDNKFSLGSY